MKGIRNRCKREHLVLSLGNCCTSSQEVLSYQDGAPEPHRTILLIKKCKSIQIKKQCPSKLEVWQKIGEAGTEWAWPPYPQGQMWPWQLLHPGLILDILDWARRAGNEKRWKEKTSVQSSSWHPRNVMSVTTPCRPYFSLKLRPCWNSPNDVPMLATNLWLQDIVPWHVSLSRIHVPEIKHEMKSWSYGHRAEVSGSGLQLIQPKDLSAQTSSFVLEGGRLRWKGIGKALQVLWTSLMSSIYLVQYHSWYQMHQQVKNR